MSVGPLSCGSEMFLPIPTAMATPASRSITPASVPAKRKRSSDSITVETELTKKAKLSPEDMIAGNSTGNDNGENTTSAVSDKGNTLGKRMSITQSSDVLGVEVTNEDFDFFDDVCERNCGCI